jgi:hypothetical protein
MEVVFHVQLIGIMVSELETIVHLLFVDDVLCSVYVSPSNVTSLKRIRDLYSMATGMAINLEKSCILTKSFSESEENSILNILSVKKKNLDEGVKCLGFSPKPDRYRNIHWVLFFQKIQSRIAT